MKALINHFIFEFKTGLRDKTMLFMSYIFPLVFYVMMGLIMTKINPLFNKTMIPAMVVFAVLVSTLLSMPNPLVLSRESGVFRSYKINGIPSLSILGIAAITTIFHMIIVGAIITLTAKPIFKGVIPENMGYFILIFMAVLVACTGIGLLIGVLSQNGRITVLWAQCVFLPSMIIGGVMMPSSALSGAITKIGKLLPSTYAMNAFQALSLGDAASFNPYWSIAILFAGGILSFILSAYLFRWDNNEKIKRPAIAVIAFIPYILGAIFL